MSILFVFGLLLTPTFAADITGNGGFEVAGSGGATDSDLWTEFGAGNPGSVTERASSAPFSGSFAHYMRVVGSVTADDAAGISQNSIADVGLASLQENTDVNVSYMSATGFGTGGAGFAVVRILNGSGAIVADSGPQIIPEGSYASHSLPTVTVPSFGPPPNDVYAAFVSFEVVAVAGLQDVSELLLDDVLVDATLVGDVDPPDVPMTSGGGLAAMGLLLLAAIMGMVAFVRTRPLHSA